MLVAPLAHGTPYGQLGPAEAIGHLGGGLRPPMIRGPQIVIIYYIILLSHLKKNKKKRPSLNPIRP